MDALVLDTSLREAAALVGLGHEALRKFINGTTEQPHKRSIRSMAALYLERNRLRVAEVRTTPSAGHLKLVLPRGVEPATEAVKGLFDAWREGRRPPPLAADLERWLVNKVREEYAAEPNWAPRRKRSRA
jgi:phage antirepressor YoqD-like protein